MIMVMAIPAVIFAHVTYNRDNGSASAIIIKEKKQERYIEKEQRTGCISTAQVSLHYNIGPTCSAITVGAFRIIKPLRILLLAVTSNIRTMANSVEV